MVCTPSAQLEALEPYTTSQYADEGTLAHRLAEIMILERTGGITKKQFIKRIDEIKSDDLYTGEMWDYAEGFTTYVLEQFNSHTGATLFTEDRVDLTRWVPDGFGTVDIRIVADGVLHVIDLKYGKGVPVFADDNAQLKLYALGAWDEMRHLYNIRTVKMTIYQPRLDSISTAETTIFDLTQWAENVLRPRAAIASVGAGDFVPGSHCGFCKIKHKCKALATYNMEAVREAFTDPALLTPDEIAKILQKEKSFIDWIGAVSDYAYDQAINHGVQWPQMKLVEGRSVRTYTDEIKVTEALLAAGLSLEEIHVVKLRGITEISKLLGKNDFEKILGDFVHKPAGKPVLVPISDKRAAFGAADRAKQAFKNV